MYTYIYICIYIHIYIHIYTMVSSWRAVTAHVRCRRHSLKNISRCATVFLCGVSCRACCDHGRSYLSNVFFVFVFFLSACRCLPRAAAGPAFLCAVSCRACCDHGRRYLSDVFFVDPQAPAPSRCWSRPTPTSSTSSPSCASRSTPRASRPQSVEDKASLFCALLLVVAPGRRAQNSA